MRLRQTVLSLALLLATLGLTLTSCNDGPAYVRPPLDIPGTFRFGPEKAEIAEVKAYMGDLFWWDFFQDETLKDLIATALVKNYDVKLAAEKIEQARAQVGLARSAQYPNLSGVVNYSTYKYSEYSPTWTAHGAQSASDSFNIGLQSSYQVDFWGQYRNATAAQRATLLATEEARNVVFLTLVSQVATAYFQLLELDMELEISKSTLTSREQSLALVTAREEGGVATMLDVDQAKVLVITAQATITQIQQQQAITEDYLSFLLGMNPRDIPRGKTLLEQLKGEPIPPGLPSSLLINRPDIRQAELQIVAANLQIGAARALFFPQISLTAQSGSLTKQLTDLFLVNSYNTSGIAALLQPIYNAGQIKSNVQIAESVKRQAALTYQRIVLNAFKEVSDALVSYQQSKIYRKQMEEQTATLSNQSDLANMRYEGGVSSYLEVLDTETRYFSAELALAKAQLNELLYIVNIYAALGGGWNQAGAPLPTPLPSPLPTPSASAAPASSAPTTAASPSPTTAAPTPTPTESAAPSPTKPVPMPTARITPISIPSSSSSPTPAPSK
ncbi:MAG: TolC family protein [Candidatus Eremiobacteraeota bacterium]|nr:TolC family protein [Candidatus Eremiobacteraeota bacterium]